MQTTKQKTLSLILFLAGTVGSDEVYTLLGFPGLMWGEDGAFQQLLCVCVGEGQAEAFLESPRPQLCRCLSSQRRCRFESSLALVLPSTGNIKEGLRCWELRWGPCAGRGCSEPGAEEVQSALAVQGQCAVG